MVHRRPEDNPAPEQPGPRRDRSCRGVLARMLSARRAAGTRHRPSLAATRRVVVKVGSALVVDERTAAPREAWLASAPPPSPRCASGVEVVVVSSGAIALARHALGLTRDRPLRLEEKQPATPVGQIRLAGAWQAALAPEAPEDGADLRVADDHRTVFRAVTADLAPRGPAML